MSNISHETKKDSLTVAIVRLFTTSHLSLVFLIISLLAGATALVLTPREEDPQIIVPVMDIFVQAPGISAAQVEQQVTTPLEVLLKQIQGVETVYSVSRAGEAVVTVRYFVGENLENSVVKTRDKLLANQDSVPASVTNWVVKPVEIDDVPILLLNLTSQHHATEPMALRRVADELIEQLRRVDNVGKSWVVGGSPRRIMVYPDLAKLSASQLSLVDIQHALQRTNINIKVGTVTAFNQEIVVEAGPHYSTPEQLGATVIKTHNGRMVYLRELAQISDSQQIHNIIRTWALAQPLLS